MTHLNIQQGSNVEIVTTLIILKLYEAALSVPEPSVGEEDAAYMSGNLLVTKAYRNLVEYLTSRFDDLNINVTVVYYIPFEDSNVLNVLLTNNIGDGIGVTEAEAANATFTSSTFLGNTDITSFNAFKYFTKANTNPPVDLFFNCTNLTSIDLSNVTTLSINEFRGTALTSVDLAESTIISISQRCFNECTSLATVNIPTTCTLIGNYAFSGDSNITLIVAPFEQLTGLGSFAFDKVNCFGTSILNFENLISIGRNTFRDGTANITRIRLLYFPKLTNMDGASYWRNNNLHSGAFININTDLIYFKNITKMYSCMFALTTCTNLVINNVVPPVWANDQDWTDEYVLSYTGSEVVSKEYVFYLSNITNIYVPDSAVTTYQNDTNWSTVASKIQPLSQLTKVATEADLLANQIALIEAYM